MRAFRALVPWCTLTVACDTWRPDFLDVEPRACDPRTAFYPDADGDGVGSTASVYIGCEAPEGYVTITGDCADHDPDTTACPDTGADTGLSRSGR